MKERICDGCGVKYTLKRTVEHRRQFCSAKCYHTANSGAGHKDFTGGRWFEKAKGYMMLTLPNGKHRAEHVVIAEKALGRRLKKGEVVHHINGNKLVNRNTNLLVCTIAYHSYLHAAMGMKYAAMLET